MKKEEILLDLDDGYIVQAKISDVVERHNALKAMEIYAKQECIDFLEWATGRNLEISLGVFVDNEGTYNSMEEYYGLYLQSKGRVV